MKNKLVRFRNSAVNSVLVLFKVLILILLVGIGQATGLLLLITAWFCIIIGYFMGVGQSDASLWLLGMILGIIGGALFISCDFLVRKLENYHDEQLRSSD
mgnify:CR=1 FL=1